MDFCWLRPIYITVGATATVVAVCAWWSMRNRHDEDVLEVLQDLNDEEGRKALKDATRFEELARKFIREAREKVERLRRREVVSIGTVSHRIDELNEVFNSAVEYSEVHFKTFLTLWGDTEALGLKLSKQVIQLREELKSGDDYFKKLFQTREADFRQKGLLQDKILARQQEQIQNLERKRSVLESLRADVSALQRKSAEQKAAAEKWRLKMFDLKVKEEKLRCKDSLRYSNWIWRLNDLSGSLLVQKRSWEALAIQLESEKHVVNKWQNGDTHRTLDEEVFQAKLHMQTKSWDASLAYQQSQNSEVHNRQIQFSQGSTLMRLLMEEYRQIRFSRGSTLMRLLMEDYDYLQDSSFTSDEKSMFKTVLKTLFGYFFPHCNIEDLEDLEELYNEP